MTMNAVCRLLSTTLLTTAMLAASWSASADRIKDLASISGVRDNQLVGYGLVVGLDGTGDGSSQPFTQQSMRSMLARFGIRLPDGVNPALKNVAGVSLNATLPPFAKPGQAIDITVSTIGDAKSLHGGTLLMSPLKGADGRVYAIAQGPVVVGGFGVSTGDGNSVSLNVPTVGRIPNGATVERAAPTELGFADHLVLNLHQPDFTTATRLADAVNENLGGIIAVPLDGGSIRVQAPHDPGARVQFMSTLENLSLVPAEAPARVIVNARTGTVVIGQQVRVETAAVAHGNLTVTVSNAPIISQPAPFAEGGTTVVESNTEIEVVQEDARAFVLRAGVSLDELVRAINQVGASPSDLVSILQALKEAGALRAELTVI